MCEDSSHPMTIWPFKKPRDLKQERDLNQLIFDYAEYQRPADKRELIALLKRTELFALLATDAPQVPNGTRYVTGPNDSIALKTAQLGDLHCTAFFTDRSIDPRLQQGCISMNGEEALRMVLKAGADGIVVQGRTSYFGLDAQGIRDALGVE